MNKSKEDIIKDYNKIKNNKIKKYTKYRFNITDFVTIEDFISNEDFKENIILTKLGKCIEILCPSNDYHYTYTYEGQILYNSCVDEIDFILRND